MHDMVVIYGDFYGFWPGKLFLLRIGWHWKLAQTGTFD